MSESIPETLYAGWKILPAKLRHRTYVVLALTLIGTFLETAGIGLIIPAIALMADPNIADKYSFLVPILEALGNPSQAELIIYGVLVLLASYVIKALYLVFLSWKQSKFVYDIKAYICRNLFKRYICSPYEFHLQQNSGHLIRNITIEVEQLVNRVLIPGTLLITELLVITAIAVLLFVIQPVGALALFVVMGLAMYGFHQFTRKNLKKWGSERQLHEGNSIKIAQEGLGGIKDVKLHGKEANFIDSYSTHIMHATTAEQNQFTISNIPRLWLETVGVLGLTLLVIIALQKNITPSAVIPIIGLFGAAAFRVLSSANRILFSIQSLKYADAVTSLIFNEMQLEQDSNNNEEIRLKFNNTLELRNVYYRYPSASNYAISDVSLCIKKGESIGLIGASGAGKSTLIDLLLGLIRPTSGGVFVDGINIEENTGSWQNLVGYVQQSIFLTDDTLKRNIAFGLNEDEIDDEQIINAIKASQLEQFVHSLPEGIETFVGERGVRLSGGQRQRIAIARALYRNTPVLVFDEATSALDNETEAEVMESIQSLKGKCTMIIVAHRLSTIEHCDKVFKLQGGELFNEK